VHLTFGVRTESDRFYAEQFEALGAAHPGQFHFTETLSKPGEGWSKARGRVTDHFRKLELPVDDMQVYLCGNGAMIEEMSALLAERGVPPKAIVKEKYFDATPA
jgi:NAD(P)H-flavin reductase